MKDLINKEIILYFVFGLIVLVYGSSLVFPKFTKIGDSFKQINESKAKIQELESQKQQKEQQVVMLQQQSLKTPVKVFKSIYPDVSIENSSVDLVSDIVKKIQDAGNTITSIIPPVDNTDPQIKAKLPESFHVLVLKLSIEGTYSSLENFFKKMYAWDYLYSIDKLTLKPSGNSKVTLNSDIEIWMYIEK